MKKKNLLVATLLPIFFGGFGLFYSSTSAAIRMIIFSLVLAVVTLIVSGGDTSSSILIYPYFIISPFVILWNVHITKKHNEAIDKNENYSDISAVNSAQDMIIPSMISLLLACAITALIGQFTESNIFANDPNVFYLLLIITTIVLSIIPERR